MKFSRNIYFGTGNRDYSIMVVFRITLDLGIFKGISHHCNHKQYWRCGALVDYVLTGFSCLKSNN